VDAVVRLASDVQPELFGTHHT
jgi:hypothetical protein